MPRERGISKEFGRDLPLLFTLGALPAAAPSIWAASLSDSRVFWFKPSGAYFTGRLPVLSNFNETGEYRLYVPRWDAVTRLRFDTKNLTSFGVERVLPRMTGLTQIDAQSNPEMVGNPASWILPPSLQYLYVFQTALAGNVAGWALPPALKILAASQTGVFGDINGWILPPAMETLSIYQTSVGGDIGGWTLPGTMKIVTIWSTSVSGDISRWVLPAGLTQLTFWKTAIDYGTGGALAGVQNGVSLNLATCALTQDEVDHALADCVASGAENGTLTIHGTNAPPSAQGLADKATLESRGWTVTVST